MIDGGLRKTFHARLKEGIHWQSVESVTGLGIPDSNFCGGGVEGWVEFKMTKGWAVTLRPEQVGWIMARTMRGGRVFVATRRMHNGGPRLGAPVDELWIHRGRDVLELNENGLRGAEPVYMATGGQSLWHWPTIREILMK